MAQIIIDKSPCSIVLQCQSCKSWFALVNSLEDAHDSAAQHEQRAHPGELDAQNARAYFRRAARRHAARQAKAAHDS